MSMKELQSEWGRYISVLLSPDVLLSVVGAGYLGYWSNTSPDVFAKTIGTVVMGLLTAIAGGRISKRLIEDSRSGQIFTRGQSAVRGLGLILTNLVTLESQLERSRAETSHAGSRKDFTYIKGLCVVIQRQAVNSIEEWKDILPEADIQDLIQEMKGKLIETDELRGALDEVQQKLDQSQNVAGAKDVEVKALREQKAKLEKELREKEMEAFRIAPSSISGLLSGVSIPSTSSTVGALASYESMAKWGKADSNEKK